MSFWKAGLWKDGFWKDDFWKGLGASLTVPNVIGMTQADATVEITALGLLVNVELIYAARYAEGLVAFQNPRSGSDASPGDTVDIYVSLGVPPDVGAARFICFDGTLVTTDS